MSSGSFRDPSGYVFSHKGCVYRRIANAGKASYALLMESGLYKALSSEGSLVEHEEVPDPVPCDDGSLVIKPTRIPLISYPYEWSFSQLRDAALLTLRIQGTAIKHGMSLKDASAYNIQFCGCNPVFIDTLSFERLDVSRPWVAYKQFCQHFLAPLALMSFRDVRLGEMLKSHIDGIPLDLASKLLPAKTYLRLGLLLHLHLHARAQSHYASGGDCGGQRSSAGFSERRHLGLLDNLRAAIEAMRWQPGGTEWADYYDNTNYPSPSFVAKGRIIEELLDIVKPSSVWDIGGNIGLFSKLASAKGIYTACFDIDPSAVEFNYLDARKRKDAKLLPLLLDLVNPSPGIGWENDERDSFSARRPCDTAFALALIHHLAISNNLPLGRIASFFARTCEKLVIEFVPKSDSQVKRLLASREDIFPSYAQEPFEKEFSALFTIVEKRPVPDMDRTIYLMTRKP